MRRLRGSILLTLFAACCVMLATAGGPEADSARAVASAPEGSETAPIGPAQSAGVDVVEGRVVVRLKHSLAETFVAEAAIAHGGAVTKAVGDGFLLVIDVPEARVAQLITVLERNPLVAQAGRDLVVSAFDVPNDPSYGQQWHLQDSAGGIDAEGAWDIAPSRGQGVVVAVIDTGVAFESHSAPGVFGQKVFQRAPDFAGVTFVAPFDFIEEDSHANDEHGHGTHVAMTIAQATDNGIGAAGVSRASIMPLRVLDFSGNGSASDLIDAIYYAADSGADVINMSLGFSGTGSPDANGELCSEIVGLAEAMDYAYLSGVTVVAAAGNEGASQVACPAAYPTAIAVGAVRLDGQATFYSNSGAAIDVAAPGGDPNVDQDGDGAADQVLQETYCLDWLMLFFSGQYNSFCQQLFSGTSMASPHVAGVTALLIAEHETLSPDQVRTLLQETAREAGPAGWDASYGWGIVDAHDAVEALLADPPPPPPPGPPPTPRPEPEPGAEDLLATATSATAIRLDWTDNATGEAGFKVERSPDGVTFAQVAIVGANATTYTSQFLTPGTEYWFRVRSYAGAENSVWSAVVSVSTLPPPAAPSGLDALGISPSAIRLTWTDNTTTEQGFKIERSSDGTAWTQVSVVPANATTWTNSFLAASTTYQYRVRAYEGILNSAFSSIAMGTTLQAPSAPVNAAATATSPTTIRVDWQDASTTEQGFKVERSTDGLAWAQVAVVPANGTTYTNWSLAPSTTYHYRVRAYEGLTNGNYSNVATATTQAGPTAPGNVAANALGASTIRLTWTDTSNNEQGFKIERSTDGVTWSQVSVTIANATAWNNLFLPPETTYQYRVRAYLGTVNSDYSSTVVATTFPVPPAPTGLSATTPNNFSVRLDWLDASGYEQGFKIERSLDGTNWTQVGTAAANATTWTSYGTAKNTLYYFRVRAYEGMLNGLYSEVVSVTTLP